MPFGKLITNNPDVAAGIIKLATAYETVQYPSAVLATFHARDFRDVLN
nr:hypothetical protein [Paenibacillus polymyxa]